MTVDRPLSYDEVYEGGNYDANDADYEGAHEDEIADGIGVSRHVGEVGLTNPPSLLGGLRSGDWLDAQHFAPVRYSLPGIIPEGSTLFVGPPKIGKSWFLLALCLGVACGGRMLSMEVQRRPVLYLALEDSDRRLQDRCRKLLAGDAIPAGFGYLTRCQPGQVLATVQEWTARHADAAPLVALDTLGKVMPPALVGESTYQRDYRVGSALKRQVDDLPGASLVIAHHDRKAESSDFIDSVSGSNGLAGSADTIVLLSRPRHELTGSIQVTGRDVAEGEYAVRFVDGSTWELDGSDLEAAAYAAASRRAADGLGDRSAEVLAVVAASAEGVRARDVADKLGISEKTAGTYLGRLAASGRVNKPSRGLYTPVGSVGSVGTDQPLFHTPNASNTPTAGQEP